MAMVLVGAGLMVNSLLRMMLPSPGFEPTNVLTMAVNCPEPEIREIVPGKDMNQIDAQGDRSSQKLIERVEALPGVESAGMISFIPPLGE